MRKYEKKRRYLRAILTAFVILGLLCTFLIAFLRNGYEADTEALRSVNTSATRISVGKGRTEVDTLVFTPGEVKCGLVFYPGGLVEYEAYAPLMELLSEEGVLCVIVKEPFDLAFFEIDAASEVTAAYPEVTEWYLCGHSLGGVAASMHAEENAEKYEGIVLLASYSTKDLSKSGLRCLSIYGSEDGVLNMKNYEKDRKNLPEDTTEAVIEGGCHAYFGYYGAQRGDGVPTISREAQLEETASLILSFVGAE